MVLDQQVASKESLDDLLEPSMSLERIARGANDYIASNKGRQLAQSANAQRNGIAR